MKSLVTLTCEESKRLIARAVAQLDSVKKAFKEGIIGLARCTSCGYIAEELIGRKLDLRRYCSGYVASWGLCALPPPEKGMQLVLRKGQEIWLDLADGNILNFIHEMGEHDVIIKSGNAIDPQGRVGVLVADPTGGEAGQYLPHILSRGIQLIVPTTLNKTIPVPLDQVIAALGISRIERTRCHGLPVGMIPMPGAVVTEIDAFRILTGTRAIPIAMGGIASGAGTAAFLVEGSSHDVDKAWDLVNSIKGEPHLEDVEVECENCPAIKQRPGKSWCGGGWGKA